MTPGRHWWEASALTTKPSLLPKITFSIALGNQSIHQSLFVHTLANQKKVILFNVLDTHIQIYVVVNHFF